MYKICFLTIIIFNNFRFINFILEANLIMIKSYFCKKSMVKKFFLNKYFYVGFGFLLWMLFADQESLVVQHKLSNDIKTLEKQKEFYLEEIEKNQTSLDILTNDTTSLEKFARENYFMKKDNEEVFVVIEEEE